MTCGCFACVGQSLITVCGCLMWLSTNLHMGEPPTKPLLKSQTKVKRDVSFGTATYLSSLLEHFKPQMILLFSCCCSVLHTTLNPICHRQQTLLVSSLGLLAKHFLLWRIKWTTQAKAKLKRPMRRIHSGNFASLIKIGLDVYFRSSRV